MSHEFDLLVKTMAKIDEVLAQNLRAKVIVEEVMSGFPLCPICHYAFLEPGERQCLGCRAEEIERETRYGHHRRDRAFEDSQKEI